MEQHNKTYGFVIAIKELVETVPNLFRYASAYKRQNNFKSTGLWEMFLKDQPESSGKEDKPTESPNAQSLPDEVLEMDPIEKADLPDIDPESMEGENYNMCHFWSNFEIARLDFFRSKEYEDFFNMMDRSGGFWAERVIFPIEDDADNKWGDAPIHSLGAGILLSPSQIHYFRDIGYQHTDIQHCPANAPKKQLPRPAYENEDRDQKKGNWDTPRQGGVGCRCECPTDLPEVEDKDGSCLADRVRVVGGYLDEKDEGKRQRLLRRALLGS
jgi:mannosyltransferase